MNKKYISLALASVLLTACGSSKSKEKFDIADYLPSEDVTKSYLQIVKDKKDNQVRSTFYELVTVNGTTIEVAIDGKKERSYTIQKESIIKKEFENNTTQTIQMKRSLSTGDTFYSIENTIKNEPIKIGDVVVGTKSIASRKECKLNDKLDTFTLSSIPYKDDILEFECLKKESVDVNIKDEWEGRLTDYQTGSRDLDYDLSYFYLKKGVGLIADADDNCYVMIDGILTISDKSKAKECKSTTFVHKMFL